MSQVISMLMSFVMLFIQFITSFIGGGGTNPFNPEKPTDPVTPDTSTSMCWPLNKESYISAGYPNYDDGTYNGGIEIVLKSGSSEGEPFVAAQDGKVTLVLNDGNDNLGYGNCVLIDHGSGISTFYAHAKSISTTVNAIVKKGDAIGYIGKTGNAKGANLHFEVWKDNARVNPLDYVKNPYGSSTPSTPETPTTPTTPETPINPSDIKGSFTFKVYGWGHGVGMSQDGAIAMAKNGSSYSDIISHYFPGTNLRVDFNTPAKVTKNGAEISIVEYLCKTVMKEIGDGAPMEALKAQAVASYTYAKLYGYGSGQSYNASFAYSGTNVEKAVWAVCGMSKATDKPQARYVEYNNKPAETYYFANAAGKTASYSAVWGGTSPAYLQGGVSSSEKVDQSTKTYTAKEIYDLIQAYAKSVGKSVTLGTDPSKWIQIVSHDKSMSDSVGYVVKVKVGGIEMSGNTFRSKVINYGIRSHCFTVSYSSKAAGTSSQGGSGSTGTTTTTTPTTPTVFTLPKSAMITGVPYINQNDNGYPMGCEATSAAMVLNYYGYNVKISDIVAQTPKCSKYFKKDNVWYGGDPFKGFVGDPTKTGSDGAYGCFAAPIVTAMKKTAGDRVYDISGCSENYLFTFVAKGCPVIVWGSNTENKLSDDITWKIVDDSGKTTGKTFTMIKGEHCMVLVGYDEDYVYLNNPNRTANYKQDKALFLSNWKKLYSQAIIVI